MKVSQLIGLDCAKKENKKVLYESLLKLPFFKDKEVEDITADDLENAINKISKKYPVKLGYILSHGIDVVDIPHHSFMLKTSNTHEHLTTIFALTLYEGLAKTVLYLFAYVKNNYGGGK